MTPLGDLWKKILPFSAAKALAASMKLVVPVLLLQTCL